MLRQSFPQALEVFKHSSNENQKDMTRSLLVDIVHQNHLLYSMETRDRPNNLIRLLVELHKLGATKEQLAAAYQKALLDVESIRTTESTKINESNWEEFLGISSYYNDYLFFFDKQLKVLGIQETLAKYFYSVEFSVGSQIQPIVQLAFGIEHNLPEIISQALAYHASTYLDVSNILDYCDDNNSNSATNSEYDIEFVNKILFDLIRADQRFDGKIEGNNTLQSVIKLLLKSQSDLIKTYMKIWSSYRLKASEKLDVLIYTAITLTKLSSRQSNNFVELDWFLAGGQLLESALAIKKLVQDEEHLNNWVNIQFLSTICTFIVQGRPMNKCSNTADPQVDLDISEIINNSFDDTKLILNLSCILKIRELYPQYSSLYYDIIQLFKQFSKNGTWVKTGLGWLQ